MRGIRDSGILAFLQFSSFFRCEFALAKFSAGGRGRLRGTGPTALGGLLIEHDVGILAIDVGEPFTRAAS